MNEGKTEIYLERLPRWRTGIDWGKTINHEVEGIYRGKLFKVKITDYERNKKRHLTLEYKGKEFDIYTSHFINCNIGNILGEVTSEFKIEIGQTFKDDKRDITIIAMKYIKDNNNGQNRKYYKYRCNNPNCGFNGGRHYSIKNQKYKDELWVSESCLLTQNVGCSCCSNPSQIVVEGINDIPTTAPWMVKYFQGGYKEAKKYAKNSNKKVKCICPDCRKKKTMNIYKLYQQGFSCPLCSDGLTYPNKFMGVLLKQLKINFISEYSPDWASGRRYDFYIPSKNLIIEMDGAFHKEDNKMNGQSKEESKFIDEYKDFMAKKSGIDVIRIDCNYKSLNNRFEYIKNNTISKLRMILELDSMNWVKIGQECERNKVKEVCDIWKESGGKLITYDVGKIVGLAIPTIIAYLKQGNNLGWCEYNPKEEMRKGRGKGGKSKGKPVKIFKDGIELGEYPSVAELDRCSEKDFGVKMDYRSISTVCRGEEKSHKGFTFKYIEENESNKLHNQELVQAS